MHRSKEQGLDNLEKFLIAVILLTGVFEVAANLNSVPRIVTTKALNYQIEDDFSPIPLPFINADRIVLIPQNAQQQIYCPNGTKIPGLFWGKEGSKNKYNIGSPLRVRCLKYFNSNSH